MVLELKSCEAQLEQDGKVSLTRVPGIADLSTRLSRVWGKVGKVPERVSRAIRRQTSGEL